MNKQRRLKRGKKPKTKGSMGKNMSVGDGSKQVQGKRSPSVVEEIKTQGTDYEGPNCTWAVEELVEHYEKQYLSNDTYSFVTMNIRNAPDRSMLMSIYKAVVKNGGFRAVTAECGWESIHNDLNLSDKVQIFELYKTYLFHYEKIFNKETALALDFYKDGVSIEDLDPDYLIPVKIFEMNKPEDLTQEVIDEILKQDVCVIRNFEKSHWV